MRLVGITGQARSGKDTLADYLVDDHGFLKMSFAAPIRRFVADITSLPVEAMEDGPHKELPLEWLDGATPRYLMQTVGTEWGRNMINRDLWVLVVENKVRQARREGAAGVVISDVRFDNEAEFIHRWGGTVVRVSRDGATPVNSHSSEAGISDHLVNVRIENNGPLSGLRLAAGTLAL